MQLDDHRILVTGGAGFIGSKLVTRLDQVGCDVHVVDSYFTGESDFLPATVSTSHLDIRNLGPIKEIVRDYDPTVIIHLAAIHHIPYCTANPEETFNVNVIGTRNVLSAARELDQLAAVVYASTAAVYPPELGPLHEEIEPDPIDIYGRTKLVGEDLLREFSQATAVPSVSARLFNVYGPNETNMHLIPAIIEQIDSHDLVIELGNLYPERDFVNVHDVVRAFVAILRNIGAGYRTYNIGTGTSHSVREVVETVDELLEDHLEIKQDEHRVRDVDRDRLQADMQRLSEETGWSPEVDLRHGLDEILGAESDREL